MLANIHQEFSVETGSAVEVWSLFASKFTSGAFSKFSATTGVSDTDSVEASGKIIEGIQDSSAFASLLLSAEVSGATESTTGAAAGSSVLFSDWFELGSSAYESGRSKLKSKEEFVVITGVSSLTVGAVSIEESLVSFDELLSWDNIPKSNSSVAGFWFEATGVDPVFWSVFGILP